MTPPPKPITQYNAQALTVRIDKRHDRAVINFIPHGLPPVSIHLPLAALDRFLRHASVELAAARAGDPS